MSCLRSFHSTSSCRSTSSKRGCADPPRASCSRRRDLLADGDLRRPHRRRDRGGRRVRRGVALAAWKHRPHARLRNVLWQALAWGAGIEFVQVFLVSGVVQGASALARTSGIALGLLVGGHAPRSVDWVRGWPRLRVALQLAWVPYLALLAAGTGLFSARLVSVQDAWARLADVRLMPFYYHYYVSEQWALVSAALHTALYAPVGALAALARLVPPAGVPRTGRAAVLVAGTLALLVEAGKLFAGRRPDPTDLVLAMAGSYVAFRVVTHFIVDRRARLDRGHGDGRGQPGFAVARGVRAADDRRRNPAARRDAGPGALSAGRHVAGCRPLRLWRRAAPLAERMVARAAGTVACPRPRTVDRLAVPRRVRSLRDGDDRRAVRSSAASSALAIPGGTRGAAGDRVRTRAARARSRPACRWTRCRRTCCGASSIGRTRCARRVPCYGRCCCWRSFAGGATAPHAIWRSSLAG